MLRHSNEKIKNCVQHGIAKSGAEVINSTFVHLFRKNHFLFALKNVN